MASLIEIHRSVCKKAGFPWHEVGFYNLNLLAVRSAVDDTNLFDDAIIISYLKPGQTARSIWAVEVFRCTTDPGRTYREHPLRPEGCAIVAPGHYHLSHKLGEHKGKPALEQVGPLTGWRLQPNESLDRGAPTIELPASCKINVHGSVDDPPSNYPINRWSAGCMVVAGNVDRIVNLTQLQKIALKCDRVSLSLLDVREYPELSEILRRTGNA